MDPETLELKMAEAVLVDAQARAGPDLSKIIAAVAPLMGLLGTVTGMIITFQAITIFGAGDPKAMAGGISSALVTTVLGLLVAIPTVLLHTVAGMVISAHHSRPERASDGYCGRHPSARMIAREASCRWEFSSHSCLYGKGRERTVADCRSRILYVDPDL